MRLPLGVALLLFSLAGMALSFISDIVVTSSITAFNGLDISVYLGVFFAVTFISGIFVINSATSN